MSEIWLTKRELARELRTSTRTIERLGLPAMRVGGQNRYRLSEVQAHLRGIGESANVYQLGRRGGEAPA